MSRKPCIAEQMGERVCCNAVPPALSRTYDSERPQCTSVRVWHPLLVLALCTLFYSNYIPGTE